MDRFYFLRYEAGVTWRAQLRRIADEWAAQGSALPAALFEEACREVGERLGNPLSDPLTDDHFVDLVGSGSWFAAAHLLVPPTWPYSIQRDAAGRVTAVIQPAHGAPAEARSDDEGVALIAALANALRNTPAVLSLVR